MAELALDDVQQHALARGLERVRVRTLLASRRRCATGVGPTTVGDQCWRRMFLPRCVPYRCDVAFGGADFTIVVGFDGTPRAEDALALGELLAVRGGARLVVVCVYVCRPLVSIESGEQARSTAARAGALLGRRCRWSPVQFLRSLSRRFCSLLPPPSGPSRSWSARPDGGAVGGRVVSGWCAEAPIAR